MLNISSKMPLTNSVVQIHDITGRLALSTTLTSTSLDIATLPAGVYSLQVITPKGIFNKKIVKQ
jgi:hypothetical protein